MNLDMTDSEPDSRSPTLRHQDKVFATPVSTISSQVDYTGCRLSTTPNGLPVGTSTGITGDHRSTTLKCGLEAIEGAGAAISNSSVACADASSSPLESASSSPEHRTAANVAFTTTTSTTSTTTTPTVQTVAGSPNSCRFSKSEDTSSSPLPVCPSALLVRPSLLGGNASPVAAANDTQLSKGSDDACKGVLQQQCSINNKNNHHRRHIANGGATTDDCAKSCPTAAANGDGGSERMSSRRDDVSSSNAGNNSSGINTAFLSLQLPLERSVSATANENHTPLSQMHETPNSTDAASFQRRRSEIAPLRSQRRKTISATTTPNGGASSTKTESNPKVPPLRVPVSNLPLSLPRKAVSTPRGAGQGATTPRVRGGSCPPCRMRAPSPLPWPGPLNPWVQRSENGTMNDSVDSKQFQECENATTTSVTDAKNDGFSLNISVPTHMPPYFPDAGWCTMIGNNSCSATASVNNDIGCGSRMNSSRGRCNSGTPSNGSPQAELARPIDLQKEAPVSDHGFVRWQKEDATPRLHSQSRTASNASVSLGMTPPPYTEHFSLLTDSEAASTVMCFDNAGAIQRTGVAGSFTCESQNIENNTLDLDSRRKSSLHRLEARLAQGVLLTKSAEDELQRLRKEVSLLEHYFAGGFRKGSNITDGGDDLGEKFFTALYEFVILFKGACEEVRKKQSMVSVHPT